MSVQRDWQHAKGDNYGMSMDISFGSNPDFASIQRDCPSMELKRDKLGWFRPVSRNDQHDRRWKREMGIAEHRYREAEKQQTNAGVSG